MTSPVPPIACNLTAIPDADRPRYFSLRAEVLGRVDGVTEIADGYALHVRAEGAMLVAVAEWIAFERACCPFLRFVLTVDGEAPVRLELRGAEGIKEFLRAEFADLERARLVAPASLLRAR